MVVTSPSSDTGFFSCCDLRVGVSRLRPQPQCHHESPWTVATPCTLEESFAEKPPTQIPRPWRSGAPGHRQRSQPPPRRTRARNLAPLSTGRLRGGAWDGRSIVRTIRTFIRLGVTDLLQRHSKTTSTKEPSFLALVRRGGGWLAADDRGAPDRHGRGICVGGFSANDSSAYRAWQPFMAIRGGIVVAGAIVRHQLGDRSRRKASVARRWRNDPFRLWFGLGGVFSRSATFWFRESSWRHISSVETAIFWARSNWGDWSEFRDCRNQIVSCLVDRRVEISPLG